MLDLTASLHVFISTCWSTPHSRASASCFLSYTLFLLPGKRSKQVRLRLFKRPQATLQICQQIPRHQRSSGPLIPLRSLFAKTKASCVLSKIDLEACRCRAQLDLQWKSWKSSKVTPDLLFYLNKTTEILVLGWMAEFSLIIATSSLGRRP